MSSVYNILTAKIHSFFNVAKKELKYIDSIREELIVVFCRSSFLMLRGSVFT